MLYLEAPAFLGEVLQFGMEFQEKGTEEGRGERHPRPGVHPSWYLQSARHRPMTGRRHQLMFIPFTQPNNWEWYVVVTDRKVGSGGQAGSGNARLPVCFLESLKKRYKRQCGL